MAIKIAAAKLNVTSLFGASKLISTNSLLLLRNAFIISSLEDGEQSRE